MPNDDPPLIHDLYDAVDVLDDSLTKSDVFPAIFDFFEKFPSADFGSPGPLVHLIEDADFTQYAGLLLSSLERRPVSHTLWMANRLLNDEKVTDPLRSSLVTALKNSVEHPLSDDLAREAAIEFLDYQNSKS
jgi:hypothetical protein